MKCTLDSIIEKSLAKTHKVDVIRRYIRMKYRINIDAEAIQMRAQQKQMAPVA